MAPEEASYLLGFINNVSPSFVITFLVTESLERPDLLLPTLLLLYGTAILYGLFTRPGTFSQKNSRLFRHKKCIRCPNPF